MIFILFNKKKGGDQMNDPEHSFKAACGATPHAGLEIGIWSSLKGVAL
jgi:hypothetical protein